jgi:hypothetical protein
MTALRTASIGALIVAAGAAQADVTAEEVWQNWQQSARQLGETQVETGAQNREGDTLTITDMVFTLDEEDGGLVVRLPRIDFTETGDGTVEVRMSESYPVTITGTEEDGAEIVIDLSVEQTGLALTVSGTPEAMRHDYEAARYAMTVESITEDGAAIPAEARFALDALRGSYLSRTGPDGPGGSETEYDLAADTLALTIESEDRDETGAEQAVSIDASVAEVALSGRLALPEGMEEAEALPEGFALGFDYATGPALVEFDAEGPQGRAAGTARTASSAVQLSLDPARVAYDSSTKGLELVLPEGPMPFRIEVSAAEYGFGIDLPLGADAAPQDLSARVTIDSLAFGDPIWDLFDRNEVLPREPATLIVELSGSARLPRDLADLETAGAMGEAMGETGDEAGDEADGETGGMPEAAPEIESLALDRLVLRLAGAEILGDGAFTFDNADLETFDGFPRPEGRIDLRATGLNGLLENLANMGVFPAEQMMGVRMMLGLFSTTVGNDELTSEIVIDEAGQVTANGQRIR